MSDDSVTWNPSATILPEDAARPTRQVYVWIITSDQSVVIVSKDGKKWQLPGGKPEVGETMLETAVREVREETGLDISEYTAHISMFGYYTVKELGASADQYTQIRCFLNIPQTAAALSLHTDDEDSSQASDDAINYVRAVPVAEIDAYIPWMPTSDEYRYLVDHHIL